MNHSLIHILPEHVVNQIKAGEVVERPANIVKEIIENSIDAFSKKIDIHIIEEGLKQISVIDDGHGIPFEDIPLAFRRHATSKIIDFNSLYDLSTFGFRGEALASIASVSKILCHSNFQGEMNSSFEISGGEIIHHAKLESKGSQGTSLFIKDLFYNTPVRLKFNQSRKSEKRHIIHTVNAFILSNPHIQFSMKWDEADKTIFPPSERSSRVSKIFYKNTKNPPELLSEILHYEDTKMHLYISEDSSAGFSYKEQYLFINGRYFENKQLHNLICRNLSHIWPDRNQGHYVLFIETTAQKIDVNVHPQKIHIKFEQNQTILSLTSEICKKISKPHTKNESFSQRDSLQTQPNFYNNHDHSHHEARDLTGHFSAQFSDNKELSDLTKINEQFYIFKSYQDNSYIVDSYKILAHHIQSELEKDHIETFPLLVSEMISSTLITQTTLEILREKGFEMDNLGNSKYALRTLPQFLISYHYQNFITKLIESIVNGKTSHFSHVSNECISYGVMKNYIQNSFLSLVEKNVIIELTSEKLASLWK